MQNPRPKTVILYKTSGGELANQLWNYASVKAYCLERHFNLENYSFYEYGSFFKSAATKNFLINTLFFTPMKAHVGRKWSAKKRLWRKLYKKVSAFIGWMHEKDAIILNDAANEVFYLPPTENTAALEKMERNGSSRIYLSGWLFRNPKGLETYRKELVEFLRPKEWVEKIVDDFISPLRSAYPHLIGVHIRQGDYVHWKGGAYFIEQKRVREILDQYLTEHSLSPEKVCFIIASDGHIDKAIFSGLNIALTGKSMIEDLFILSKTETVLGSDSTFGDFAAWYGNVPHIIFQKERMDWEYYRGKKTFFQNTYCTWVHY